MRRLDFPVGLYMLRAAYYHQSRAIGVTAANSGNRIGETQLRVKSFHVADLRQRGQLIQAFQVEVVQKLARGRIHSGTPWNIAMPDNTNPLPLMQGLDDIRANRHAADFLDFATGNRLAIGDQGQGFQQRPGILLGSFLPQARHPGAQRLPHLEAETAGDFLQFEAPTITAFGHFLKRLANSGVFGAFVLLEQLRQLRHRERFAGRQQRALDNLHQTCFRHIIPT